MAGSSEIEGISFVDYVDERQLDDVMALVGRDLSEPYSSTNGAINLYVVCCRSAPHLNLFSRFCFTVFTYRYFLARYPGM
jgi:hypothetical protein